MKILVIGGMHGNEPLGKQVVNFFQANPVENVDVLLANRQAIERDCRFVKNDLNRSFPGDLNSPDYEIRRAAEILKKTDGYDLVLDFHNTYCPNNDCGFVGQSAGELLDKTSALLGLRRIIVADYDCINKFASNCLSIEISMDSQQNDPKIWYERIVLLSRISRFDSDIKKVVKYRFVYRITLEDKEKLDLPSKRLEAFQAMDAKLAKQMDLKSPAYPIFVGDKFTPYNYGGFLNRL